MDGNLLDPGILPTPVNRAVSFLLVDGSAFNFYLLLALGILTILVFVQWKIFSRPPPVPLKKLPRRPALSILFKPDDISATTTTEPSSAPTPLDNITIADGDSKAPRRRGLSSVSKNIFSGATESTTAGSVQEPTTTTADDFVDALGDSLRSLRSAASTDASTVEAPMLHLYDLPDSFAPLLSSSQTELLLQQLTADLLHAIQAEASVRVREGKHEIPLNKNRNRPQFQLLAPKGGVKLTASAVIGSDKFTLEEDLDVTKETKSRSKPMVKRAGVVLDPPMPLANVAPTLIHFPTLFEDKYLPSLRRIQIVRLAMDFIISISSWLEKLLWVIERFCQIHLSDVRITPIYRGREKDDSPEWRLSLSFSGHVLLFGVIPIPFISVTLPTFIIPQPHALLDYLLTKQPLASAELKHENIEEQRLALAIVNSAESWNVDLKVVATPPAFCVDVTLPGGVGLAMELMYGRDPYAGWSRNDVSSPPNEGGPHVGPGSRSARDPASYHVPQNSSDSMSGSSWTTRNESFRHRPAATNFTTPQFDANEQVPWSLEFSAKGTVSHEKVTLHVRKCSLLHAETTVDLPLKSKFGTKGSLAVWKVDPNSTTVSESAGSIPAQRRTNTFGHRPDLAAFDDVPSVAALLLFPDDAAEYHRDLRMLQYDYAFDVFDDTRLDAVTFSLGANHPMLNGGTMITTMLESIYAFGSFTARAGALLDPCEYGRKRNILLHLPAIDFSCGIQNIFIPPESNSYSDDGQTNCIPELESGRMTLRVLGGMAEKQSSAPVDSAEYKSVQPVAEGIKVVADFGVGSLVLRNETMVNEFPELDIFEGSKLRTHLCGVISGSCGAHLRPQKLKSTVSSTGPNIFNPLEAYEVDFSGTDLSLKLKETSLSLGHRRLIIPTETTVTLDVVESVIDMSAEGQTKCEVSWDFQGLSPILQVTEIGETPERAAPENKQQVSLLIAPLRQGRLTLNVSSVGGIHITKAATSRDNREGLYDWKFFNALVSPDAESAARLIDVLMDRRSMDKVLGVAKLINKDLDRLLNFALPQVWRAKEIFDQEGVSDPKHAIPAYNMARLISLFLSGDDSKVDVTLPLVNRVVAGEGLDVVKVKDLLRDTVAAYDEWAPEIDRAVRWLDVMFSPMAANPPYVENEVPPLCELKTHAASFRDIPSARQLYEQIHDKPHLPLDPAFSSLVSRVAPYLSFRQIEYFLQIRAARDWQAQDLRRIRYVYSIKRKVLQIAESYGGLSFLPQSFLVSVFLGEATRSSLKAARKVRKPRRTRTPVVSTVASRKSLTLSKLRKQRANLRDGTLGEGSDYVLDDSYIATPAGRVASRNRALQPEDDGGEVVPDLILGQLGTARSNEGRIAPYVLGDSLLGPQDVAILLQAGLTSAMKSSTVVQLNQRMLLDLMASQPRSFVSAVLAEIGTPGGQGSSRALTSALMALLDLDQNSFKPIHRLDMHALLEEWLPGMRIPKREDYMAGGRWARQSYYAACYAVACSILEDAECYMALKSHVQRDRRHKESDPLPLPKEEIEDENSENSEVGHESKIKSAIKVAKSMIADADAAGRKVAKRLMEDERRAKRESEYEVCVQLYRDSFDACAEVLALDKIAFHTDWFQEFYKRNYDALMIKSIFDNVMEDVDNVRYWLHALRRGARQNDKNYHPQTDFWGNKQDAERIFMEPGRYKEQELINEIIYTTVYDEKDREKLRDDPLVRLLLPNPPGHYNFTIVTAMGVITEGKRGLELKDALQRLREQRGVRHFRADTGTARSFEYNSSKIQEAIACAVRLNRPYGLVGYSQGCANILLAESELLSGSPLQQKHLVNENSGLVCRQLLFSAANGSMHGPSSDKKVQRLIVMCEEFFKYQQGYSSRALASTVIEALTGVMDSAGFQKFLGGAQGFLPEGCRAFWRESQHLAHVPTCVMRGVLEDHTTPECLEMLSHVLTKQSGSPLHDSQVHVYDAVGYPVYHRNRNGRLLKKCAVGDGYVQRAHHWSPLSDEVEWVRTPKDIEYASFDCAKDRHLFPWVDVNVRFGFIKYVDDDGTIPGDWTPTNEMHPSKLVAEATK